jgi:hypothetical protein
MHNNNPSRNVDQMEESRLNTDHMPNPSKSPRSMTTSVHLGSVCISPSGGCFASRFPPREMQSGWVQRGPRQTPLSKLRRWQRRKELKGFFLSSSITKSLWPPSAPSTVPQRHARGSPPNDRAGEADYRGRLSRSIIVLSISLFSTRLLRLMTEELDC